MKLAYTMSMICLMRSMTLGSIKDPTSRMVLSPRIAPSYESSTASRERRKFCGVLQAVPLVCCFHIMWNIDGQMLQARCLTGHSARGQAAHVER